ncbi:MAG: Nif11-like leader peptide family natural product precursor [Acidobacteria bacterium]|nr:Nif11-like leader peptide family natural product precursor [Acidobacteriota bacterium]
MTRHAIFRLWFAVGFLLAPTSFAARNDRCSPPIANQGAAPSVCSAVCAKYGMIFAGNWSDDSGDPAVKSCLASGAGSAVCGCQSFFPAPTVEFVRAAPPPRVPTGLKAACVQGPEPLSSRSDRCPILAAHGLTFRALSYLNQRDGMAIVGYDSHGDVVSLVEKPGARNLWNITLDTEGNTVSFVGESSNAITLERKALFVPQAADDSMLATYVLWPTATGGRVSWTNGVRQFGTPAVFGTKPSQLLDPFILHSAAKQLCAQKQMPWFHFGQATGSSPYSVVTCVAPPAPGERTYNQAFATLMDAAINSHSLMAELATAKTDAQIIAVAAKRGYTITAADITQSRGATPPTTPRRRNWTTQSVRDTPIDMPRDCGRLNQPPCEACRADFCNEPGRECWCETEQYCEVTTMGLSIENNICVGHCGAGMTCGDFVIREEYNDEGTDALAVCAFVSSKKCAVGIPDDALAAYEVFFRDGLARYRSTDTLVNTWTDTRKRGLETLYVINAIDKKIYMVNVEHRYIQVRGSANCVGESKKEGESTAPCKTPRLTTHAGILMGSIARLPTSADNADSPSKRRIYLVGAGTIRVTDGVIQWITNDSGHFLPTKEDLDHAITSMKSAGAAGFPDSYVLARVGRPGVYCLATATAASPCPK